jgi:hypothetical protein
MDRNPTVSSRSIPEWGFSNDPRSSAEDLDRVRSVAEMRSCFLHLFRQGRLGTYWGTCGMIRTMIPSIAGSADGGRQASDCTDARTLSRGDPAKEHSSCRAAAVTVDAKCTKLPGSGG